MEFNQLQKDVKEENGSRHKATEGRNNIFIKHSKRGGWTTFPFILGSMLTLTLTAGGWIGNLIVYLITKYNVKSIHATQVFNVVVGCMSLFPIVGAVLSDSFYGSFVVIALFSFVSLLGITLMTLTASFPSLRPPPCTNKFPCESPSKLQYGVLYTILGLACIGIGGTRYTLASMGADQFEDSNSVGIYFNWYFFVFYAANVISTTAIIYVQDNVSWAVGFGICIVCNTVGVILFLSGKNFYRKIKPKGSPFTSIARVIIAAVRKRKVSSTNQEYNYDINDKSTTVPSDSFRYGQLHGHSTKHFWFFNNGALKIESDGSKTKSWSLTTVQEVEDLKTLIKIMPLWSSSIMLSGLVGMFNNFIILQALSMDRHLGGSNFKIPASSFLSLDTLATSITICLLDRLIFPMWQKLTGWSITPLQRIGLGHVLNVVGLVTAALVEVRRLHMARDHNLIGLSMGIATTVPISALWLLVPLTIMGISQAFLFPGQISLYYQEFPTSLRSTSTAMISLLVAVGFYLSTALTGLIQKSTSWLKDDLNNGRLDIVYWLLAAIGVVNFGYFLVCAKMFRHKLDTQDQNVDDVPVLG
ncbi:putative ABC-type nitrate transporter [Helianthus annuus]|nr:putative ABC-type nitrate transporter [Helianthus annuus]